jgi:hypothetical protein
MRAVHALLPLLLLLSLPVSSKTLTVRGEGSATCAAWTQEHATRSDRQPVQDSWILGYVNGISESLDIPGMDDVSEPLHNADLVVWIGKYCSTHPTEHIIRAASELMRELARRAAGANEGRP